MSVSQEPAFDWEQVASLLGDDPNAVPEEMAQILRELVESAEVQFDELKRKNPATEQKAIASKAHALRGCLLNFGFTGVGELLLQVEKNNYAANEFLQRMEQAYTVFHASKKQVALRYPSVGIS